MSDETATTTPTTEDAAEASSDATSSENASTKPPQTPEDESRAFEIEEAMRDVVDPELGINVVDLGLVYDIWVESTDSGGTAARIDMTLTSAACPLTDVIEDQAKACVVGSGVADELRLNWVWMPPWGPHMITDDGREQLRALGFTV